MTLPFKKSVATQRVTTDDAESAFYLQRVSLLNFVGGLDIDSDDAIFVE